MKIQDPKFAIIFPWMWQ